MRTPIRQADYEYTNHSSNTKVDSKETKKINLVENISNISNFISEDENLKINKTEYEGLSSLKFENKNIFMHNKLEPKEITKFEEKEKPLPEPHLKSIKVYNEIFGKNSDFVLSSDESSLRRYEEWNKNKDIYKKNFIGSGGSGLSLSEGILSKKGTLENWTEPKDFLKKNFFESDKNAISPVKNQSSAGGSLRENTSDFFKYSNSDLEKVSESDHSLKNGNLITITNNKSSNTNTICINSSSQKELLIDFNFSENNLKMNIKVGENSHLNSLKKEETQKPSRRYEKIRPNSRYSHLLEESEKKESKAIKKVSLNSPRNKVRKPFNENDSD